MAANSGSGFSRLFGKLSTSAVDSFSARLLPTLSFFFALDDATPRSNLGRGMTVERVTEMRGGGVGGVSASSTSAHVPLAPSRALRAPSLCRHYLTRQCTWPRSMLDAGCNAVGSCKLGPYATRRVAEKGSQIEKGEASRDVCTRPMRPVRANDSCE